MQSQNLSKKSINNISIFTKNLTEDIFKDLRFVQLMNLLIKHKNLYNLLYCFYCDNSIIKTNLFVPTFHTIYMACGINNVIIKDSNDIWIKDIFKQNNYYVLNSADDTFNYESAGVTRIKDIKEIGGIIT